MKRAMAVEGQRIDVILKEFDKPDIPTDYTGPYIAPKKGKTELVNDYADLYKNFSEFNARYIPERAREIKVLRADQNIEPYHVTQHKIIIGPPSHADPPRRPPPPPVGPAHPARAAQTAVLRRAPGHRLLCLPQAARPAPPGRRGCPRRPPLDPRALQAPARAAAKSRPQRQARRPAGG